jgi:hypothetical protein
MTEWKREGQLITGQASDGENWMAEVHSGHSECDDAELEAIATLMHAAPELLDMVRRLAEWRVPCLEDLEIARALLKRLEP